jgi:hypothetical protein
MRASRPRRSLNAARKMGRAKRNPSVSRKKNDGFRKGSTHPTGYRRLKIEGGAFFLQFIDPPCGADPPFCAR